MTESVPGPVTDNLCGDQSCALPSTDAKVVLRGLTKAQRMYVRDGSIHGDCAMRTTRALVAKGLFGLVIDSPNGQCGFMRLTPLGNAVQAALADAARSASPRQLVQPIREDQP